MSEEENDVTTATVYTLPPCDFCKEQGIARDGTHDGKTTVGPWAYMCDEHFTTYGTGLGLGVGQQLIVSREDKAQLAEQDIADYEEELANGDDLG